MPSKQSQKPRGRVKSSIVLRLNLRLFLRLLGIYVFMDLLLLLLTGGGVLLWADRQCADVSALVEERGVPSAEATVWMAAGDYTVSALTGPAFSSTARISTWVLSATTRSPGACAPWIWAPPPSSSAPGPLIRAGT